MLVQILKKLNDDHFPEAERDLYVTGQSVIVIYPFPYYLRLLTFANVNFVFNVFLTYPHKETSPKLSINYISLLGSFIKMTRTAHNILKTHIMMN